MNADTRGRGIGFIPNSFIEDIYPKASGVLSKEQTVALRSAEEPRRLYAESLEYSAWVSSTGFPIEVCQTLHFAKGLIRVTAVKIFTMHVSFILIGFIGGR